MLVSLCGLWACQDDFTDPNDPKFDNSKDEGITVHTDQIRQTMHHFGASDAWSTEVIGKNWPESDREAISQFLFSKEMSTSGQPLGIGLSMWRTNIGAGSANQADNGFADDAWFRATECALQSNGSYDWTQQEGSRWFLTKAKEMGVNYVTGWITSPPYFMTKNGYTFSTPGFGGYNLKADQYDDFAAYLGEFVDYYSTQNITIDYLSPINEPQWSWQAEPGTAAQEGSPASNEEARMLAAEINKVFTEKGIGTKLILPEAGELEFLYKSVSSNSSASDQVRSFWETYSSNYLGGMTSVERLVAGHSYWSNTNVSTGIKHRTQLLSVLEDYDVDFWQTEYSMLGSDYLEGRNESDLKGIDYALWIARIIHWDITLANATGWSFWTSLSYPKWADHKYRFGLLNWYPDSENRSNSSGTIEETKNLWAFGNFSQFVRPGYQRIEVENKLFSSAELQSENLMVSGYISPSGDELVLIFINYSKNDIEVPILNYGSDGIQFVNDKIQVYVTDQTRDLEPVVSDVNDLRIRSKSIVTLVGKLDK